MPPLTLEEVYRRRRAKEQNLQDGKSESVRLHRQRRRQRKREERGEGNRHSRNRISLLWGDHSNKDIFVVGTGTSLQGFNFSRLNSLITIGLNDAVLIPGFKPTYSIFCDGGIWSRYRDAKLDPRTKLVCQPRARDQFQRYERCTFKEQVWHFNHVGTARACKEDNDDLFVARTVATGGIMMAWKFGARRIFLIGVDGYKLEGPKGGIYYYNGTGKGDERRKERKISGGRLEQDRHEWWRKNMAELRTYFDQRNLFQEKWRGSNIYNLNSLSTVGSWQHIRLRKVLGDCFPAKTAS